MLQLDQRCFKKRLLFLRRRKSQRIIPHSTGNSIFIARAPAIVGKNILRWEVPADAIMRDDAAYFVELAEYGKLFDLKMLTNTYQNLIKRGLNHPIID